MPGQQAWQGEAHLARAADQRRRQRRRGRHADQRGDETNNYVVSEQRADAIVDYLVSQGIAPSRLSSRAVGEADLLTLDNEPAALALNRRTEFVLLGRS